MTDKAVKLNCRSIAELHDVALTIAHSLTVPITMVLSGTLGAGKTQFTKELVSCLGRSTHDVTSPTFVIVHRYPTQPPLVHIDAYRVADDDEFLELGIEEFFDEEVCTVIEWGEKFSSLLPDDCLFVQFEVLSEAERQLEVTGTGRRSTMIVDALIASINPDS